jgi:predicted metalloprotease with PDZ domain
VTHYTVTIADANAHHFEVACQLDTPDPQGQLITLPAWIPGSYMIRDFARNILWLQASCNGEEVAVEKLDKQSWWCPPCDGPLTLRYRVYAWDLSVRSAHLDQTHGFFNGTSLFVALEGQEEQPHRVTLVAPQSLPWSVATTLPATTIDGDGWGDYCAESYGALIDHPVEMGTFDWVNFEVCGIPHALVLTGRHEADTERLAADLARICEQQTRFFGDPQPPVTQYLFLTLVVGEGYGGLEHSDCCALICSRNDLPRSGEREISEGYRKFLGLCSHEYFHLWNIKRIKPAAFTPYSLDAESYTRQLWAYEGITSYFDDLALLQSGLISTESYLQLLGQTLTRLQRNRGQEVQSVTESSLDAWIKFYKPDENANNAIVSYYIKGAVIALMVDLEIRLRTHHESSLQQIMQQLWREHGKTGVGTAEQTIELLLERTAGGIPFLQQALYGTAPLEVAPLLEQFGIRHTLRAASGSSDSGGSALSELPRCWLGAEIKLVNGLLEVLSVVDQGPAQQGGVAAGDRIIALDQLQANESLLKSALYNRAPGSRLQLHLFRRDELMEMELLLQAAPADTVVLEQIKSADQRQMDAQQRWLQTDNDDSQY